MAFCPAAEAAGAARGAQLIKRREFRAFVDALERILVHATMTPIQRMWRKLSLIDDDARGIS